LFSLFNLCNHLLLQAVCDKQDACFSGLRCFYANLLKLAVSGKKRFIEREQVIISCLRERAVLITIDQGIQNGRSEAEGPLIVLHRFLRQI